MSAVEFSSGSLSIKSIVVYQDRAEICKQIEVDSSSTEVEVKVTGLSNQVVSESIRVSGTGNAEIRAVTSNTVSVTQLDEESSEKVKTLQEEIRRLGNEISIVNGKGDSHENCKSLLSKFGEEFVRRAPNEEKGGLCNESTETLKNSMEEFFENYKSVSNTLNLDKIETQKEKDRLTEALNVANQNLRKLRSFGHGSIQQEVSIMLKLDEPGHVTLGLTYMISPAFWKPSYDMRYNSKDKTLTVSYYGLITQTTGEDWNDVDLSLSTASPNVSGDIPEMGTLFVDVSVPPQSQYFPSKMRSLNRGSRNNSMGLFGYSSEKNSIQYDEEDMLDISSSAPAPPPALSSMRNPMANVSDSLTNAVFDIPYKATIVSDSASHKVSIAVVTLSPELIYNCVPKKNPLAFLKARCTNTSAYAFLPGESSIFLDNNFVAKSNVKSVSPGESFGCSLGADPSIKISYPPVRKFTKKGGWLNASSLSTKYTQTISIKNTSSSAITISVTEQLPKSSNDKIKVKLDLPIVKDADVACPAKLNQENNVELLCVIPQGETVRECVEYTIEYPGDVKLSFIEGPPSVLDE